MEITQPTDTSPFVPYTGATQGVNLGSNALTLSGFLTASGGTKSGFYQGTTAARMFPVNNAASGASFQVFGGDGIGYVERMRMMWDGKFGVNNLSPQYPLDVTGDVNTSTGYRVGATAGASGTISLAKLTAGGTNGSITVSGGIITAFTNPT